MKFIKITLLFFVTSAMVQCQKDTIPEDEIVDQEIIPKEILSNLEHMGYNTKKIPVVAFEEGYIVEGDIFITTNEIINIDKNLGAKQRRFKDLVRCKLARDIKIKNNLPRGAARNAVGPAIRNWNQVNGSFLKIRLVNNGADIVIRPKNANLPPGFLALASLPLGNRAGKTITVDTDFILSKTRKPPTPTQWRVFIQHEIGHNIGFAHSDDKNFQVVSGTRAVDPNSIMRSGITNVLRIKNFSSNDKKALRKMYGGGPNFNLCF